MKKLDYENVVKNLRSLTKDYIVNSNLKSLVIGISGGIDSALVAVLVKSVCDELGIPLIGRSITIGSNSIEEQERARAIGKLFCSDFNEVNLTDNFEDLKATMSIEEDDDDIDSNSKEWKIRLGNIKARQRMMYLYNLASINKGLVLSTDNMTELLLGFWTLHGDVGDYGLIQELWKTEVYDMSEYLCDVSGELNDEESKALMSCILGDATDGLGITSTDLDQILPDWRNRHNSTRSGYSEVDEILIDYLNMVDELLKMQKVGQEYIALSEKILLLKDTPVIQRHMKSQFKRENPFNEKRENFIK